MTTKTAKKFRAAAELVDRNKRYGVDEAFKLLKETVSKRGVKFDQTVDVAINLGVDPKHADQMVRIAASSDAAVMSFILSLAISSTCFRVTLPTFSLPGRCAPEPFFFSVCSPAAFFSSTAAGGVLRTKVNERS